LGAGILVFTAKPRSTKLRIVLPASYSSTEPNLLFKTIKWGLIGRIAGIFRVDEVVIYVDRDSVMYDGKLGKTILEYMVLAPYLRKRVYPPNIPELRYAGVLPPLQLPTHGVGGPQPGECREALVVVVDSTGITIEAGLGKWVRLSGIDVKQFRKNDRVVVCIKSLRPSIRLRLARKGEVYSGFKVVLTRGFKATLGNSSLLVATSRLGKRITPRLLEEIVSEARQHGSLSVLFGAPDRGLYEIASEEGLELSNVVDYIINTIPGQGTRTVRVEEALLATLSLINMYLD
jgi:hypothetical protein